jgi:spore maturation protein CgeB
MKILIVLPLETFCTYYLGEGLAVGFRKAGHDVSIFRTGEYYEAKKILFDSFSRRYNTDVSIPPQEVALEGFFDYVLMNDIELVLVVRGLIVPTTFIKKLKKIGVTTVLYNTDDPYDYEETKTIVDEYDFVFSNDKIGEQLYKRCKWISPAVDDETYIDLERNNRYYDMSFIGTFFKERAELFESIMDYMKELKVFFAGHWVEDMPNFKFGEFGLPSEHPIKSMIGDKVNMPTVPHKVNLIYNNSKIVPCPHRDKEWMFNTKYDVYNLSPRVFEVAATNTFQLISGNRRKVMEELFPKNSIKIYDTVNEFQDLLKYYLEHEDERLKLTELAKTEVLAKHTYKHRAEEIINHISLKE